MNTLMVALTVSVLAAPVPAEDAKRQNTVFQDLWETDFVWKFDDLPEKGGVPESRIPYSGYIYPDRQGGTSSVTWKYDRAFNRGRGLATAYERSDSSQKEVTPGLFGRRGGLFSRSRTPDWYGHCNGWAAASIRHAEPVHNVTRNGVTFTPSDIKGLLAEIYIYNQHDVLAGENQRQVNAGLFHAIMANWLGRGDHPLGMEADPSEEKWNYPVYAFATSHAKLDARNVDVKMNIAYAKDSNGEWDESPRIKHVKYFHYRLTLNAAGEITGGWFYRDSSIIDMLWVPRRPKQPGQPGNEAGNPYINVDTVLAIWRASVPEETRKEWLIVDPAPLDRILTEDEVVVSTETPEAEEGPVDGADRTDSSEASTESEGTEAAESEEAETGDAETDTAEEPEAPTEAAAGEEGDGEADESNGESEPNETVDSEVEEAPAAENVDNTEVETEELLYD